MINTKEDIEELAKSQDVSNKKSFLAIFVSTFVSVFLAELGDKTQVATLLLSAESGKPVIVFIGASIALICSTLVVVILGRWLSETISQVRIKFASGILMITIGIWFAFQAINSFMPAIHQW